VTGLTTFLDAFGVVGDGDQAQGVWEIWRSIAWVAKELQPQTCPCWALTSFSSASFQIVISIVLLGITTRYKQIQEFRSLVSPVIVRLPDPDGQDDMLQGHKQLNSWGNLHQHDTHQCSKSGL
jgi:hypothetical protein